MSLMAFVSFHAIRGSGEVHFCSFFLRVNPFASGIKNVLLYPIYNGIIFSENSGKISSHYKFLCQ